MEHELLCSVHPDNPANTKCVSCDKLLCDLMTLRSFGDSTQFTIDPLFKLDQLGGTTGLAASSR